MTEIGTSKKEPFIKRLLFFIFELIIFISLTWFYAGHSLLLSDPSKPYSSDISYRLQTNAFLQGNLFLSPQPFGSLFDFLWTEHGMSQNWGLGVPLLRLPFEWGAKLFGYNYSPDKLIVIFYLALMLITLNIALRLVLNTFGFAMHSSAGLLMRWYLISWILFCPAIAGLIKFAFNVYEEAVFYAYIYSCVLFSILWIYLQKSNKRTFVILCLVSGFACLVRPTLIIYGLTTISLAILYTYQSTRNIRLIVLGIFCFCLGILLDLWLNYARFGSIFEFGYSANISNIPTVNYALRFFDYPFRHEAFLSSAKELIGSLFFNHLWESPTFRNREYTFITFNLFYLTVLWGGIALYIYFLYSKFLKHTSVLTNNSNSSKIIYFSLSWGLICFCFLFIFYLHSPYMTARYLCDFAAALNVIFIALIGQGISWLNSHGVWRKNRKYLVALFMTALVLFYISNKDFFLNHNSVNRDAVNMEGVQDRITSFNQAILLTRILPETFYCGHSYDTTGLMSQFAGWDIDKSCLVFESSFIYLSSKRCLALNYSFNNLKEMPRVQVKRNLMFLKLINSQIIQSNLQDDSPTQITEKFCSDSFPSNNVALYTIGWVEPTQAGWNEVPIKLNWVSVAEKE